MGAVVDSTGGVETMLMFRKMLCVAVVFAGVASRAQTTEAKVEFDVASVRQNKAGGAQHSNVPLDSGNVYSAIDPSDGRTAAGGFFVATNYPLWRYIVFAYKLSGTQEMVLRLGYFEGLDAKAPKWVAGGFEGNADKFNIEARAPENTSIDQMRLMMQSLLAERFHLVVHHETHEAPAFALVLARPGAAGPHLQPHPATDVCPELTTAADKAAAATSHSAVGELPPVCGVVAHVPSEKNPRTSYGGRGVPLSLLATSLPTMTGLAIISRPVVDQTGFAGLYDFTLQWEVTNETETGDNTAAFRSALKGQLGLELKPTRAPIDILVIDHVEHPSEN